MLKSLEQDILNNISTNACCCNAFLNAIISITKEHIDENCLIVNCPLFLQDKFCSMLKQIAPNLTFTPHNQGLLIQGKSLIEMLTDLEIINFNNGTVELNNDYSENLLINECCKISYLKGVFLCVGKLYYNNDSLAKSNGYNLELIFKDYQLANNILKLMKSLNLNLKLTKRGHNIVLYSKDSQILVEFLVKLGAVNTAFELQNNLVIREIRNDANRKGNCFDANLNKTINASVEQVKAIDYIINNYGLDYLNDSLREIALLRLANPESTLSELQKLYSTNITRAGIKYKLDKILAIYKQIKK